MGFLNSLVKLLIVRKRSIFIVLLFLIAIIVFCQIKVSKIAVDGWSNKVKPYTNSYQVDKTIKEIFNDSSLSTENPFFHVFKYLTNANIEYKSPSMFLVNYPGEISSRGRFMNGIEGFARFYPLATSWMYNYEFDTVLINEENYNLSFALSKVLYEKHEYSSKAYLITN